MTDAASQSIPRKRKGSLFEQLELDTRLLGMIGALLVVWIVFDVLTGGRFLTPRNLFNLSVQTSSTRAAKSVNSCRTRSISPLAHRFCP